MSQQTHQQNIKHKEDMLKQKQAETEKLYNQIKKMRRHSQLLVSDHAIVRFLERAYKMDIHKVREEIVSKELVKQYVALGDGELQINDEVRAVVKDGIIVTILK